MTQHPMTKAYIGQFVKNGGKKFKAKFNPSQLDQTIIFGYRSFVFRILSAGSVPSWDEKLIPAGVTSLYGDEIVMIQNPNFGDWLACDQDAKAEYEEFAAIVAKTIGIRKD